MRKILTISVIASAVIFSVGASEITYENTADFQKQFKGGKFPALRIPAKNVEISKLADWVGESVEEKNDTIQLKWKHKTLPAILEVSAMDLGFFPPEDFEEAKSELPDILKNLFPDRNMKTASFSKRTVGNLPGFAHNMTAASGAPLQVFIWDASRKGYNYVVKFRYESGNHEDMVKAYEDFLSGIVFPDAAAESPKFIAERPTQKIVSREYGYEIDSRGTYFATVPLSGNSPTKAEHAFEKANRLAVYYLPVVIAYDKLDPAKLLRAMVGAIDPMKDVTLDAAKAEQSNGRQVFRAEGRGKGKGAGYLYEFRLHINGKIHVLEIASARQFTLAPPRKPVRLPFAFGEKTPQNIEFNEDQRRRHHHFLMKIGNALAAETQYASARELYQEALALQVDDNSAVLQICNTYDKMKNYAAGYAVTEKYPRLVEANANLLSYKAYFAYQLKKYKEAAELYERAFADGYWAYEEFEFMLKSLAQIKRPDHAEKLADDYLKKQKNDELMRYVVNFYRENGQLDKALAVIAATEKSFGFTERIGFEYSKVYYDKRDFAAGLKVAEKMHAQGFTDPTILYNRGLFLYELRQYKESAEVFRKYLAEGGTEEAAKTYLKNLEELTEKTPAVYQSKDYAYSLKLEGTGFRYWDNFTTEIPSAEYAALYDGFGGMAIFSIQKKHLTPGAVNAKDFLRIINNDHAESAGSPLKSTRLAPEIQVVDFKYPRKAEKTNYVYYARSVDRKNFQHLILVWYAEADKENAQREKIFSILENFSYNEETPANELSRENANIQGFFLGKIGDAQWKRGEYAPAKANFKAAHALRPADLNILNSLLLSHSQAHEYEKILELVTAQEKQHPNDKNLQTWKAFGLYKNGRLLEAEAAYARVFASEFWNEADFRDFLDVLSKLKKDGEIESRLDKALKKHYSADLALFAANYHRNQRRYAKATPLYDRLISENPNNIDARLEKGWMHIYEENFKSALDICEELLRQNTQTAAVEYLKGVSLYKLSRYKEAKPSFEYVVRLNPKDTDARDYLNYVTSLLGQGQNADIQKAIAPVDIPAGYSPNKGAARATDEASVMHRAVKAMFFTPEKPERTTFYYDFSIEKESGISAHSKYSFSFDPLRERIFVNKLNVVTKSGQKIQGKAEEYYVIDEVDESNIATGKKELRIIVPGLEPGSRGELMVTIESLQASKKMHFTQSYLASSIFTRLSEVYLCGELKSVKTFQIHSDAPIAEGNCRIWRKENPVILARENLRPNSAAFAPIAYAGTADESWSQLTREYAIKIKDRLADEDIVKTTATKLVSGASTEEEKLRKITEYVQSSIKYEAIEFGTRGIIPNNAAKTIHDKFGDCKDQAVLVRQLLRTQGIAAELALIHNYAAFVDSIPSLDQFNHMIVYLPNHKGGTYFDPTQKYFGVSDLPPPDLEGQTALLVMESGASPKKILRSGDRKSAIKIQRDITLKKDKLSVKEKVNWTSYHASFLRRYFKKHAGKPIREIVQELIGNDIQGALILNASAGGLDTLSAPFTIELEYELAQNTDGNESLFIRLPHHWEKQYLGFPNVEKRRTPFGFEYPIEMTSKARVTLPPGRKAQVTGKAAKMTNPYFLFETRSKSVADKLVSEMRFETQFGMHPAQSYRELKAQSDKAYAAIPENVILKKGKNTED